MIHPPPPTFTPAHEALSIVYFAIANWGVPVAPDCGRSGQNEIVCTVDFPPIRGAYLGWSVVFRWNGRKVKPRVTVIPQA